MLGAAITGKRPESVGDAEIALGRSLEPEPFAVGPGAVGIDAGSNVGVPSTKKDEGIGDTPGR